MRTHVCERGGGGGRAASELCRPVNITLRWLTSLVLRCRTALEHESAITAAKVVQFPVWSKAAHQLLVGLGGARALGFLCPTLPSLGTILILK